MRCKNPQNQLRPAKPSSHNWHKPWSQNCLKTRRHVLSLRVLGIEISCFGKCFSGCRPESGEHDQLEWAVLLVSCYDLIWVVLLSRSSVTHGFRMLEVPRTTAKNQALNYMCALVFSRTLCLLLMLAALPVDAGTEDRRYGFVGFRVVTPWCLLAPFV